MGRKKKGEEEEKDGGGEEEKTPKVRKWNTGTREIKCNYYLYIMLENEGMYPSLAAALGPLAYFSRSARSAPQPIGLT